MRGRFGIHLALLLGDYLSGGLVGLLAAAAVHLLIGSSMDTALAMLLGMVLGMVVHLVVSLLLMPLLGAFLTMIRGSLIGMYGGMMFAMRETMEHPTTLRRVLVGVVFGFVEAAAVQIYDRALRAGEKVGR